MPTALITGSAKRIGLETGYLLAKKGYNIALHCNNSVDAAHERAREIRTTYNVKCGVFQCDLSNSESITSLFQSVLKTFGKVDLLINNASIFEESSIRDITLEKLTENFAVHLFSPALLCQAFAQQKNLQNGVIINILDKNITRNKTKYFGYLHSKKALWELTKYLAVALAPNIRTNAISPGFIIPEETSNPDETYMKHKLSSIPLKKQGDIQNILQSIEYILENDYINGQNLFVDGGSFLLS
jgi:pteridine reductase